ncbi:hypothetical protein [Rhodocyclus tenuis]|uniref:Uncharacterized protein n=1 Tax=Rhodocyclus tenuis TaxID=1066 RepID=A0A840G5U9_RHOTE|nr:hypothetical protein [Rhodocyclus tenuis]MBB4247265.1 hypothetical protein [Rhodocyclus tenuis]
MKARWIWLLPAAITIALLARVGHIAAAGGIASGIGAALALIDCAVLSGFAWALTWLARLIFAKE